MNYISIIILNWNGKHHLSECLSSVLGQTYTDYEVILVDNGSMDGSQDFVRETFPGVNLVCLDRNYGFCKGNNIGISAARGEFIVLLNNDTMVESDWLHNLYTCITSEPGIGFCASKMVSYFNRSLLDSAGDGFSICGAGYKRGHRSDIDKFKSDETVFGACAGAAMYRKDMLDRIGLLDEDFFAIYEDVDLSFRAQLAGYKCKYAANAVVYHKVNATLGTFSDFYVYYGQRNVEYAYFKNMPKGLLLRTIFQHLLYNGASFIYFTLKGKGLIFLKAKYAFLKDIRLVAAKRKHIMKLKSITDDALWELFEKKWISTRLNKKVP